MAGNFQPPPTWTEPVLVDPITKRTIFNPIWLRWFIDLTRNAGSGGSTAASAVYHQTTTVVNQSTTEYNNQSVYNSQSVIRYNMESLSVETLQQILIELRIQNIYLQQLPALLNDGRAFSAADEPEKLSEQIDLN